MASKRLEAEERQDRPDEFVQSLARGLSVIRAFSAERPELTLSEVARATNLSRAAARRFLLTLESLGYIGSNGRLFHLLSPILDLGYAYMSSLGVADFAQQHLRPLNAELHESCSASLLDDGDIVHIARVASTRIMSVRIDLGRRIPAYATAMGRVLLAALDADDLDRYFATYDRPGLNEKTETDERALRAILDETRRRGYAVVDQELENGVRSIAVPVRDARGTVIVAINATAHSSRVTMTALRQRFLPQLQAAARGIEHDLVAARM